MGSIVKQCQVHGSLTIDECYRHKRQGGYDLECKYCVKIRNSRSYLSHKEKRKKHIHAYYKQNRANYLEKRKEYYLLNKEESSAKAKTRYLKLKIEVINHNLGAVCKSNI